MRVLREMTPRGTIKLLILLIILLQVGDVMTTNIALSLPNVFESNPLMIFLQTYLGDRWWVPKVLFVSIAALFLLRCPTARPAFIIAIVWVVVDLNNLLTISLNS